MKMHKQTNKQTTMKTGPLPKVAEVINGAIPRENVRQLGAP